MANNRMALVCKQCNLGISIAKYYPEDQCAGWGQYPLNKDLVDYFFELHKHNNDTSMWGGNQYDLRYEIDDDTWQYDNLDGYEEWKELPHYAFSQKALEPAVRLSHDHLHDTV